ncbi:hypothetical protein AAEX98_02805 [Lactobacillus helveticus]|uniref:hypothetical protein n=1 Tax=Lactobacillus helveticus TaxID=1587 RepID=UPI00156388FD|nr:hypothetical protein [Lactobacillus helveticus]
MNNQEFDLGTVKHFFEHDYHDRGMMKWQGFYLSDHTATLPVSIKYSSGIPKVITIFIPIATHFL